MDRTEQTGLAAALLIHALLALLLWFGLQRAREPLPKPESINVSLVGDIAAQSSAPDAVREEAAAAEAAPIEQAAPEPPAPRPQIKPAPIIAPKPAPTPKLNPPKAAQQLPPKSKPKAPAETKPAPAAKSKAAATNAPKSGGFGKDFEGRIAGIGAASAAGAASSRSAASAGTGAGSGTAAGTVASKSGAEIRRSVTTALAGQIRPFLQSCAPSGVDVDKISTFITINLASNGSVTSVAFDKQTGVNDSNSPQADPLRQCAVKAAKQASPYRGLDPDYHDLWKSHKMQLRAR